MMRHRASYSSRRRARCVDLLVMPAFLALALVCVSELAHSAPKPPASVITAYVGGTLIDGAGGPPITPATVIVEGDRILAAGKSADTVVPSAAHVVALTGRYVIPGL